MGKGPVKHPAHSFVLWSIECEAGEVREKGCLCVRRGQESRRMWPGLGPGWAWKVWAAGSFILKFVFLSHKSRMQREK